MSIVCATVQVYHLMNRAKWNGSWSQWHRETHGTREAGHGVCFCLLVVKSVYNS